MSSVVVVGSQWGDEGKGKITDFLSKNLIFILHQSYKLSLFIGIDFDAKVFLVTIWTQRIIPDA